MIGKFALRLCLFSYYATKNVDQNRPKASKICKFKCVPVLSFQGKYTQSILIQPNTLLVILKLFWLCVSEWVFNGDCVMPTCYLNVSLSSLITSVGQKRAVFCYQLVVLLSLPIE